MPDITLSKAVRSNLLNLQSTATQLGKTQEKLATGLKVNSALDNPTNFFTASSLNSRAGDLGQLLDSVSNAVQTIAAADKGISAITKLVESAQATARQALQTAATVDSTAAATSASVTSSSFAAVDLTNSASAATAGSNTFTYAGDATAFGATDTVTFEVDVDGNGSPQTITINQSIVQGVGNSDSTIDSISELTDAINAALTAAGGAAAGVTATNDGTDVTLTSGTTGTSSIVAITNATADADGGAAANTLYGLANDAGTAGAAAVTADTITFDLTVGATTQSITLDNSITASDIGAVTADEIAAAINSQFGSSVADGSSGEVVITDAATGASSVATIASFTATGAATTSGLGNGTDAGSDATTVQIANPERETLRGQYNDLLTQIDQLAADASFNGVNLLNGDSLSVLFNEDGTSSLDVTGVTFNAAGLGLTAVASGGFDSNTGINSTLDLTKAGIDTLRSQSSTFGSNLSVVETRQDFTKNIINVLETGAANLTLADSNEEAANLLALQTRQQLSSTALSLASQADQNVLRLF